MFTDRHPTMLLEANKIGRRHPNGTVWLLDDVSLSIEAGSRVAMTGPSGGGKTLLLRALARLDPLDRGAVQFKGQTVQHDAVPHFRSEVIYLHQRAALIEDTAEAALRKPFALKIHRHRRFDRDRAVRLLAELGRDPEFLGKRVSELSGGEIQITALARALALDPVVLLLDEPTAALDPPTATAVERLVSSWLDENPDRAMVWVSHNEAQAARVGRVAIRMEAGRLAVDKR
jgi:putative ABC transport system ATP-binding protein